VDAVIWDLSENPAQDLSPLNMITEQHQGTLFLICAKDDTLLDEAMWNGASMYFVKPLLPEQLQTALDTIKKV
jgi:AmiR/NasT family two-component response regulator